MLDIVQSTKDLPESLAETGECPSHAWMHLYYACPYKMSAGFQDELILRGAVLVSVCSVWHLCDFVFLHGGLCCFRRHGLGIDSLLEGVYIYLGGCTSSLLLAALCMMDSLCCLQGRSACLGRQLPSSSARCAQA